MIYRQLGKTGLQVSVLSQGGAAIGLQYGPVTPGQAADCVHAAIDAGVNLIDTSAYYGKGRSEEVLGEILQGGWREKIILCTKAGRYDASEFDFTPASIRKSLEASLRRLRTDHIDILIAHDIEFASDPEPIFTETAACLHDLKKEGKIRYLGMSGLPLDRLRKAIERCQLDVVISYTHFTLQNQRLLSELLPIANQYGVGVMNGSPLCMGLLSEQGPPPWHPGSANLKAVARKAVEFCQQQGTSLSFLGMQYCYQESRIPTTITGTARKSELDLNLKALTTPIDRELLKEVQQILAPIHNETWPSGHH